ncbi:MAG: hypothetical protein ABI445_16010 [Polyangia bacterium]
MSPRTVIRVLPLCIAVTGCGGGSTVQKASPDFATQSTDMAITPTDDMASASTADMGQAGCGGVYMKSTIAAMRQGAPGCYELDGVVTLAVTPTTSTSKSVTFYVQDAAGGDYSAVRASCSSTSMSHPCPAFPMVKASSSARTVTLTGTYIRSGASKGGYEQFYPDAFTDTAAGTLPTPIALAETDLERGTTTASTGKPIAAYYFQLFTTTIADKLLMYDWTASEFTSASATAKCKQFGFGMIPTSAAATAGAACTGTTQPAGQATVNPKEVLIGTDFYSGFKTTTDCVCGPKYMDPVPTAGQGTSGSVTGLLSYDVPYGTTTGYLYVAPLLGASFPIQ